jgi:hypothetical protein
MDKVKMRDLVLIRKRTIDGEKTFAAVVTSIERIYNERDGSVEHLIGYEPVDPRYGTTGATRIPRRGDLGTIELRVISGGVLTRAERWQGAAS